MATGSRERVHDITSRVRGASSGHAGDDGLLHVFVPHATAGIALVELGSGSDDDLLTALSDLLSGRRQVAARAMAPDGHGRSHVMPALIPPYATDPGPRWATGAGHMAIIAIVDLNVDNRERQVRLSFLSD